ncbi:MAG: hypothetical protein COS68_03515 [Elusimicrobia bacterium CG06_land_8_20_14_3_00_38_11]|nr:MAG: hypothetical protein COS68_03515 [Elusimicrobia bacterium CG06_land_8_20_14_3_00_38_11]
MYFFWRLLLAHLLADFTFQTNRIAKWKREDISGVFFHVLIFLFFAVAINYQYLPQRDFAVAILIIAATHVIEDQWRVYSITKYNSPDNIGFFLGDQFVHILLIFVLAPVDPIAATTEKWVFIVIFFVVAAQFSTILIYFIKKLFYADAGIITREKYHGIAERILIVACFIIPGKWYWLVLPFAVMLVLAERFSLKKTDNDLDFSAFNIITSNAMAIILSIAARSVWY